MTTKLKLIIMLDDGDTLQDALKQLIVEQAGTSVQLAESVVESIQDKVDVVAPVDLTRKILAATSGQLGDDVEEPPGDDDSGVSQTDLDVFKEDPKYAPEDVEMHGDPKIPWDERIHAGTKTTIASGNWKRKKAVSDELVAEVTAELVIAQAAGVEEPPTGGESEPTWTWLAISQGMSQGILAKKFTVEGDVTPALAKFGIAYDEFALLGAHPEHWDAFANELGMIQ